jgi:hypothetical protein
MTDLANLAEKYVLPPALKSYIDSGVLELISEDEANQTLDFTIRAYRFENRHGDITTVDVYWTHPGHHAAWCRTHGVDPKEEPNFEVIEDTTDLGEDYLDINTIDELIEWLSAVRA